QPAERATGHIDAFPEGRCPQQYRALGSAKLSQEIVARVFAVDVQRTAALDSPRAQLGGGRAHVAVAREEPKHSSVRSGSYIDDAPHHRLEMTGGIDVWRRCIGRYHEQRV